MIMTTLASLSAAQQAGKAGTDALAGHVGCSCRVEYARVRETRHTMSLDDDDASARCASISMS